MASIIRVENVFRYIGAAGATAVLAPTYRVATRARRRRVTMSPLLEGAIDG
jgi:hypothetical protein